MLDIIFGRENVKGNYILDTRIYFRREKKPEWFQDHFVQRVLKEVDHVDVLFEEALRDRFGHGISTEQISTGSKTLILIYFDKQDRLFNGSAMGDNCLKFLFEMARKRDIRVFFEHYPYIDSEYFEEGLVTMNGKILGEYDFDDAYCDWIRSWDEDL